MLYRLSGTKWTGARPVVPSGAKAYGVEHVSCATATFCAASLASLPNSYLDVLTDNRLRPEAVHAPSGTSQKNYRPDVFGLQCPAAQDCVAVIGSDRGQYYDTDFLRLVGSDLDGQAQHRIPTPGDLDTQVAPTGYLAEEYLIPVTLVCPSPATCFATNHYYAVGGRAGFEQSVVARLANSTVHVFVMPEVKGTGDARTTLVNIDCPSPSSCVAVGRRSPIPYGVSGTFPPSAYDPQAAYVTFADGVWTPGSLPAVADQPSPSQGQFVDLDCPAVGHCFVDADYAWAPRTGIASTGQLARSTDLDAVLTPN